MGQASDNVPAEPFTAILDGGRLPVGAVSEVAGRGAETVAALLDGMAYVVAGPAARREGAGLVIMNAAGTIASKVPHGHDPRKTRG